MAILLIIICVLRLIHADIVKEEVEFLNELPLEKLLRLKSSLQQLVTTELEREALENVTTTTPVYQNFGAQAMAVYATQRTPIKRGDYEEVWHKGGHSSKISNIFSMSVTTLAFLAFGGYLLCLIVHAVKNKQMYYNTMAATTMQPTFFVSAGIKKKPQPQPQFASYGRKRRENRIENSLTRIDMPPEQIYAALIQLCEGYAKWSKRYGKESNYAN